LGRVDLIAKKQVDQSVFARVWPWLVVLPVLIAFLVLIRLHNLARRRRWRKYRQKFNLPQNYYR